MNDKTKRKHRLVCAGLVAALIMSVASSAMAEGENDKQSGPSKRKTRYWDEALSAEDYMRAYNLTGQAEARVKEIAGGVAATQWTRSGPLGNFPERAYNGRMASIFLHGNEVTYTVYAGASSGGLWWARGTDGVPQWANIGESLPNPSVKSITMNPENIDDIVVGTGDYQRYGGGGIFRTTDGGTTWNATTMPPGYAPDAVAEILRSPVNPSAMWACTSQGILRSTTWGATWTVMERGFCTDMVMDPTDPAIQYATFIWKGTDQVDNGAYKTENFWVDSKRMADPDIPTGPLFERSSIAICDGAEENLVLLVETDSDLGGIFKSADYGESWDRITPIGGMGGFGQIFHAQAIAIVPGDPDHVFAGSVWLWETKNGGTNWTRNTLQGHADITQLHFDPVTGPDTLWILNDGGIYKHTVGDLRSSIQSWNGEGATGLNVSQIHDFDAERDMQVIGLQDNGTLQSFDAGANWNFWTGGDGFGVEIIDSLQQRYWYADGFWPDPHPTIRMWRNPFGAGEQEAVLPGPGWRERMFYDRHAGRVYTAGAYALESSAETGSLGFTVDLTLPPPVPEEANDARVFGSQLYGDELYITYWKEPKLTVRRKVGGVWTTRTTTNISATADTIDQVFVSTENPGESWVGLVAAPGRPKLAHTTDYWVTKEGLTGALAPVKRVRAIAVTPMNSKQIFVGTDVGVFRTIDGGTTWLPFQDGLPIVMVTDIFYVPDPNRSGTDQLVVSTYGRGVYNRPIAGPALTYVDPNHVGDEDGMFPHPFDMIKEGVSDTPAGGTLALRGRDHLISAQLLINTSMLIRSYDGSAYIGG